MNALVTYAIADVKAPRNPYAHGYGPKIPTRYRVRLASDSASARLRRVYVAQYANAGTAYVIVRGEDVVINEHSLFAALPEVVS